MNLPAPAQVHFQIPVPDKLDFFSYQVPAVSPDGERIAFTAADSGLDGSQAFRSSPECSDCDGDPCSRCLIFDYPFWSPDGQQIAFTLHGALQRVDVSGGPPVTICTCDARLSAGRGIETG